MENALNLAYSLIPLNFLFLGQREIPVQYLNWCGFLKLTGTFIEAMNLQNLTVNTSGPLLLLIVYALSCMHRLNIDLDLQSFFGLHVYSCTHWLRPRNFPPPPAFGLIYFFTCCWVVSNGPGRASPETSFSGICSASFFITHAVLSAVYTFWRYWSAKIDDISL